MAKDIRQVRVDEVDWLNLLPVLRLFRTFHSAIHPSKLFLALVMVVFVYLSGLLLDQLFGRQVYPGEIRAHATMSSVGFDAWYHDQPSRAKSEVGGLLTQLRVTTNIDRQVISDFDRESSGHFGRLRALVDETFDAELNRAREVRDDEDIDVVAMRVGAVRRQHDAILRAIREIQPRGRFAAAMDFELDAFQRLVHAAMSMNIGGAGLAPGGADDQHTVVAALYDMVIVLPRWMLMVHPFFTIVYGMILLALWAIFGGALTRMSAVQATSNHTPNVVESVRFSVRRFGAFVMAPLMPVLIALVLALVLFVAGFLAFGIPYANQVLGLVGGLLFAVAILLGLGIALVKVAMALSFGLYYPAIAIEDSDAFDANSRAVGYVCYRIWHLLFYNLAALVYMAATYIFVGGVIFLALLGTQFFVAKGADLLNSGTPFGEMMPAPEIGQLTYQPSRTSLSATEGVTTVLMMVWVYLFVGLSAAYAMSYFFTANTWIYMLLRRSADGTDYSEMYVEPITPTRKSDEKPPSQTPDKVEPGEAEAIPQE